MYSTTFQESQALTRAAPSASTEGQSMKDLISVTVVVDAGAGHTITSGSMQCWFYDTDSGVWARLPDNDFTPTASVRAAAKNFLITNNRGRLLWAAASIVLSAGTTVTVTQCGFNNNLANVY